MKTLPREVSKQIISASTSSLLLSPSSEVSSSGGWTRKWKPWSGAFCLCRRGCADRIFPDRHHGVDRQPRPQGLCANCHRPLPDADSLDLHSRNQHLGESGAQHRPGDFCRWLGLAAIVDVLGRSADRWRARRRDLQSVVRRVEAFFTEGARK